MSCFSVQKVDETNHNIDFAFFYHVCIDNYNDYNNVQNNDINKNVNCYHVVNIMLIVFRFIYILILYLYLYTYSYSDKHQSTY